MTVSYKNIGNRFSREAIKEAIAKEKISDKRAVELNELAEQVAEQFSSKSVSPYIVSGFVRLFDFLALATLGLTILVFQQLPEVSLLSMQAAGALAGALFIVAFSAGDRRLSDYFTARLYLPVFQSDHCPHHGVGRHAVICIRHQRARRDTDQWSGAGGSVSAQSF